MVALLTTLAWVLVPCETASAADPRPGLCATARDGPASPPYLAVLSAFPAELAPLVAATRIDSTLEANGQLFYTGALDGVSVVLGLLGIGMVNAERSAENLLAGFEVAALIVSGVAGSHHRIGDVVVASQWVERDGRRTSRVNRALLALAQRGATALAAPLERCTHIPPTDPDGEIVCMPFEPAVVFGGRGVSGDPFAGAALPCVAGGGEIFGCELPAPASEATSTLTRRASEGVAATFAPTARVIARDTDPDVEDMETAAVARLTGRHRIPFLAVRAVSDGAGDPLGDREFPAQFFDYYRLAATNEALVARSIATALGALARDQAELRACQMLARRRWRAAADLLLADTGG